jgi:ADP-L-glycero-D-manno-heptose 6-epimerase
MLVITGGAGFIGSCLIKYLYSKNFKKIIAVDDFSKIAKNPNLENIPNIQKIERTHFEEWLKENHQQVEFIFHLGARTDTTEFDWAIFQELNLDYSKMIWQNCISYQIPLVYASSAATYGTGDEGYDDNEANIHLLKPLNPYGQSKQDFDMWALTQEKKPFFWAGLKFFNVYGAGEAHKGRMASVIWHAFNQIKNTGAMKLFKSHNPNFKDGEQMRDFVYVKDLVKICEFLMHHRKNSGIYNLGSGKARTFLDLVKATFKAMQVPENISFMDTPLDIRDKYQYFTEANMQKIKNIGYKEEFYSLEDGVMDYVQNYLMN